MLRLLNSEKSAVEFRWRNIKKIKVPSCFSHAEQYKASKSKFGKGWLYGYADFGAWSLVLGLGFDTKESVLFLEMRTSKKIIAKKVMGKIVFDPKKREVRFKGKTASLVWKGAFPRGNIIIEAGKLKIKLDFLQKTVKTGKLTPIRGIARFVKTKGEPESFWMCTPANAKAVVLGSKALDGTWKSKRAYTEKVRAKLPFVNAGWYWHGMFLEDKKWAGLMEIFLINKILSQNVRVHQQLYTVDLKTGTKIFKKGEYARTGRDNPRFVIASDDNKWQFAIDCKPLTKYRVKGMKYSQLMPRTTVDYVTSPCKGTAKIGSKQFKVSGTSELTGEEVSFWI